MIKFLYKIYRRIFCPLSSTLSREDAMEIEEIVTKVQVMNEDKVPKKYPLHSQEALSRHIRKMYYS